MMRFFILGANDPEMREIEAVLISQGEAYAFAMNRGYRVIAADAYMADRLSAPLPQDAKPVFVECSVMGLIPEDIIDHHQAGDPGHDKGPSEFLAGSSLGQLLSMLGLQPTYHQKLICAADHCLTHAYQGLCPGVSPRALAEFRLNSKAETAKVPLEVMQGALENARESLKAAEKVDLWGVQVAWVAACENELLPEASAQANQPFMYERLERNGRHKVGILGAPARIIEAWMRNCGLQDVYGSPERGYAGGYV